MEGCCWKLIPKRILDCYSKCAMNLHLFCLDSWWALYVMLSWCEKNQYNINWMYMYKLKTFWMISWLTDKSNYFIPCCKVKITKKIICWKSFKNEKIITVQKYKLEWNLFHSKMWLYFLYISEIAPWPCLTLSEQSKQWTTDI